MLQKALSLCGAAFGQLVTFDGVVFRAVGVEPGFVAFAQLPAHANTGDPNGPVRGLSASQIACALISIMARSTTCSKQRPDTLMQDRICRIDENLLHRTAEPYIRVKSGKSQNEQIFSALHQKAVTYGRATASAGAILAGTCVGAASLRRARSASVLSRRRGRTASASRV